MIRRAAVIACSSMLILTVALWVASWIWCVEVDVFRSSSGRYVTITHVGGRISIMIHRWTPPQQAMGSRLRITTASGIDERISMVGSMTPLRERPHFERGSFNIPVAGSTWAGYHFAFPHWLVVLLFLAYPIIAFIHGPCRRYRRYKKGLCLTCGYNLTGNVSGVCPECGQTANAQAAPKG